MYSEKLNKSNRRFLAFLCSRKVYTMKILLFVKCFLLLWCLHLVDAGRDIPMTKCCQDGTVFLQAFDSCRNGSEQSVSWSPAVYSESSILIADIAEDDFKITTQMKGCSDGQIAVSTTKFKFLVDGSLRLDEGGRTFQVGQFCLNQVFGSEGIVARFCDPDPCIEADTRSAGCIRKCCPIGMDINPPTFSCQPSSSPSFDVQFRNELGEPVDRNLSSYVVRGGVIPKCIDDSIMPLGEAHNETFYVLPNAQIFIPGYSKKDQMTSDYCIDSTDEGDGVSFIVLYLNVNGKITIL